MLKLFKTLKNSIHRYHVNQKGSMPLAILMSVFIISSSLLIASTTSLQVLNNRNENVQRQAAWALDSTANLAAETMGTASRSLADLPTTPPPVWYASDDGTYVYRWWIEGTVGVLAASGGGDHSCAILSDRSVKCWGANATGQLGNGTTTASNYPVAVTGIDNATQIGSGVGFSCALLSNNTVKCWGVNDRGQLGNGNNTQQNTPVLVSGITNATQLSVGRLSACVTLSTGGARCWGLNDTGQLGNASTTNSNVPVAVSGLTNVSKISIGGAHACAVEAGGLAKCWGLNDTYQLGDGTTTTRTTPVTVAGINDATNIGASPLGRQTCLTTASGGNQLYCWGTNTYGQIGDGTTTNVTTPKQVAGVSNIIQINMMQNSTCALSSNSIVKCWGLNTSGQLGDGTTTNRTTPITIDNMPAIKSISQESLNTTFAVADDGRLYGWGLNTSGQVGDGTATNRSTPAAVLTLGPYALTPTAKMQIKLKSLAAAGLTSDSATFQAATSYVWNPATNSWDTIAYYSQY